MKKLLFAAAASALIAVPAMASGDNTCQIHHTETDGSSEGGWVVSFPTGSSDYFNVRHDVGSAIDADISLAVADFGASASYPTVGVFNANTGLDPAGNTPDLSSPIATTASPAVLGGPIGDRCNVDLPSNSVSGLVHAVAQLPPGDSGLLGIHADSDANGKGGWNDAGLDVNDSSGFTADGYSTPAVVFSPAEFGIDLAEVTDNKGNSTLSLSDGDGSDMTGDFSTLTTRFGNQFTANIHMPAWNGGLTNWLLFVSFAGIPLFPAGPILPAFDCGNGASSIRVTGTWPSGAGNITVNFVAFTGQAGTLGSIQQSNEITIISCPDPNITWGTLDDGTIESGWVVSFPSGSSDYFNTNYGPCPGQTYSTYSLAVMDFGGTVSSYPSSGLAPSNTAVDPGGNTPDLGNVYESSPLAFPSLTFCTTSGQYVTRAIAGSALGSGNGHGFIQFPPGDSGLIGVGADTSSSAVIFSGWTLDGYSTPANSFSTGNWGQRIN